MQLAVTTEMIWATFFGFSAVIHNSVLYHCGRDQSQSIHLHRQIYGRVIPSAWSYEDYSCPDFRIHFLWKRGSQFTSNFGYGHCRSGNDVVRQRLS